MDAWTLILLSSMTAIWVAMVGAVAWFLAARTKSA
jgi:hypothetical protein